MFAFLSECRKIEETAGRIYHLLAEEPAYAERVREVFRQLGRDERAHARNIDLVLQAGDHQLDAHPTLAWEKLGEAAELAAVLLKRVEAGDMDEETALRTAVVLEQEFIKIHAHHAVHLSNRKLAGLFAQLGSEDEEHIDRLRQCLTWWYAERKALLRRQR